MDVDKKMICYREPKRGFTLDQWELKIEAIPVSQHSLVIVYSRKEFNLLPALDIHGNPIRMTLGLDPDTSPGEAVRTLKASAFMLQCELFEPSGGWVEHVAWNLTQVKA